MTKKDHAKLRRRGVKTFKVFYGLSRNMHHTNPSPPPLSFSPATTSIVAALHFGMDGWTLWMFKWIDLH